MVTVNMMALNLDNVHVKLMLKEGHVMPVCLATLIYLAVTVMDVKVLVL